MAIIILTYFTKWLGRWTRVWFAAVTFVIIVLKTSVPLQIINKSNLKTSVGVAAGRLSCEGPLLQRWLLGACLSSLAGTLKSPPPTRRGRGRSSPYPEDMALNREAQLRKTARLPSQRTLPWTHRTSSSIIPLLGKRDYYWGNDGIPEEGTAALVSLFTHRHTLAPCWNSWMGSCDEADFLSGSADWKQMVWIHGILRWPSAFPL